MVEQQNGTRQEKHRQNCNNIQPDGENLLEPNQNGSASRACGEGGFPIPPQDGFCRHGYSLFSCEAGEKKKPPPRRRWSCAFIQAAGKSLSVLTTARPETCSGATPHRSKESLQRKSACVNYKIANWGWMYPSADKMPSNARSASLTAFRFHSKADGLNNSSNPCFALASSCSFLAPCQ